MRALAILASVGVVSLSSATNLTFTGIADDFFEAFISTSDSVQGSQFMAQTNTWQSGAVTGGVALTANTTNYLHIRARDVFGAPSMFCGEATLSDAGFMFANNTQSLLTNATDWNLSLTGFGTGYFTPTIVGQNGQNVWGTASGISLSAMRLWSTQTSGEHYFSVQIIPVPEPGSIFAMALGAALLIRRRK